MFSINGYETEALLHDGKESLVFRAVRSDPSRQAVILKVLKDIHPPPARIERLKLEYELVQSLQHPGVVRAHELLHASNHWVFVQEDFGGRDLLKSGLCGTASVETILSIAVKMASHIAALHQRAVIHRDLNPSNVVYDASSQTLKIIDFGFATRLSRQAVSFGHADLIEGTPAYLSPEQTGRTSHPLDHRTDLYSVGCTLYELLTGRPPFEGNELIEFIHAHLVRMPVAIRALRPEVPEAVAAVVAMLLAKSPNDRYQSAEGLHADLVQCQRALEGRTEPAGFAPGRQDVAPRPMPPSRLYGRDTEIGQLRDAFDRVADNTTELVLISGGAGVGKSSLIKELYTPVTERRGLLVAGKFEQVRGNSPYGPILGIVEQLLAHVLKEPGDQARQWATNIKDAAGAMLPALADAIPRLDLLYERLPPLIELPAEERGFRFRRALAAVIRVFARPHQPLVMVLDDLQWVDRASLTLLRTLLVESSGGALLVVLAHRDEPASGLQALRHGVSEIREAGIPVLTLPLGPLNVRDTANLLADAFGRFPDADRTSGIIHDKTGGNPFFIRALLDTLLAEGVVRLDHEAFEWRIDVERLRRIASSDNVVDLLVGGMMQLPELTRDVLAAAACIGSEVRIDLLAETVGRPHLVVAESLGLALASNYLIALTHQQTSDAVYRFAHDRVQQAAYAIHSSAAVAAQHLRIGRVLRDRLGTTPEPRMVLATADQFNRALGLLLDAEERRFVAELNLDAGRTAMRSVAETAALHYFELGLACLEGTGGAFARDHELVSRPTGAALVSRPTGAELAFALTTGAAEAAYLSADFERSERFVDALTQRAVDADQRVPGLLIRILTLTAQNRFAEALAVARTLLVDLGIVLPASASQVDVDALFETIAMEMRGREPSCLIDLPPMRDPASLSALRVLCNVFVGAFLSAPLMSVLVGAHAALLTIRRGLCEESAQAFIFFAMGLCGQGHIALGYAYGCLAEALVERRDLASQRPSLAVLGSCYIMHWRRPFRDGIPVMRAAYSVGLETGRIEPGVNALHTATATAYLAGCSLPEVDAEYVEITPTLARYKQGPFLTWLRIFHRTVRNFMHDSADPTALRGEIYDETVERPRHEAEGDLSALYNLALNQAILCYHFHAYDEALTHARMTERGNQPGSAWMVIATMYRTLAALATHADQPPAVQAALLEEVRPMIEQMRAWGETCPVNYQHRYHLMAAEYHRALGDAHQTREHYDAAADLARCNGFLHEEGLAFERAAMFYQSRGNPRLASYSMSEAYYAFERWGAEAKLAFLRRTYPELLSVRTIVPEPSANQPARSPSSSSTASRELDLASVLAASRAIAANTDVVALLETVMRVCLENAGADRGSLILVSGERLLVKVRAEHGEASHFESLSLNLSDEPGLPHSVIRYVARTGERVVLDGTGARGLFAEDPYLQRTESKSLLCFPVLSHGCVVAICYLENRRARGIFAPERIDVLALLMGQAAVSLENALLRDASTESIVSFRVGGSLPADSPTYVRRAADDLLFRTIQRGGYCFVFNTRQMGKSSLRVQMVARLQAENVACVSIDVSAIGARGTTPMQWYAGVARYLIAGLGLQQRIDLRSWWRLHDDVSPVQCLELLIDEVILNSVPGPIVVFIDEVDATLALEFPLDGFFALIRSCYNRRADDARYGRLTIVLLGVATPSDLIRDYNVSPFNIGSAIPLMGFRFDEAVNLARGLEHVGDGERLLRAVLEWTCGQPFLTQRLCRLIAHEESRPIRGSEREWVAAIVRTAIVEKWRTQDEPRHLETIEARVFRAPGDPRPRLRRYRDILLAGELDLEDSPVDEALVLAGIVTRTFDKIRVGNPVYASIFDRAWIETSLAKYAL